MSDGPALELSPTLRAEMERHAEEGYPHEVCGFLIGRVKGDTRTLVAVRRVRNAWEDAPEQRAQLFGRREGGPTSAEWNDASEERRFLVSPEDTLAAMKEARALGEGCDLIGVYHSHPNHPAIPSKFDLDVATPEWSYVIVSVREGQAAEFRSWVLPWGEEAFVEETVRQISG